MAFQRSVNTYPAPGVSGDFYGANPRRSMLAMASELTAGVSANGGVTVGRFGFARNDNGQVFNARAAAGSSCRLGFIHRDQPGIITAWLGHAAFVIPTGLEMTMHDGGDFFCGFLAPAGVGQKVFAVDADATIGGVAYTAGQAVAGPAGTPIAGATETMFYVHKACAANEVAVISDTPIVA